MFSLIFGAMKDTKIKSAQNYTLLRRYFYKIVSVSSIFTLFLYKSIKFEEKFLRVYLPDLNLIWA